jgi:hypothetical protein
LPSAVDCSSRRWWVLTVAVRGDAKPEGGSRPPLGSPVKQVASVPTRGHRSTDGSGFAERDAAGPPEKRCRIRCTQLPSGAFSRPPTETRQPYRPHLRRIRLFRYPHGESSDQSNSRRKPPSQHPALHIPVQLAPRRTNWPGYWRPSPRPNGKPCWPWRGKGDSRRDAR